MGGLLGLGDALVATPQRAAEPEIATQVLVIGMREGKFTPGHTLDRYINDRQTDYNGARAIINSRDTATADPIANLARDRKSTRLNSRHYCASRMPSSA